VKSLPNLDHLMMRLNWGEPVRYVEDLPQAENFDARMVQGDDPPFTATCHVFLDGEWCILASGFGDPQPAHRPKR